MVVGVGVGVYVYTLIANQRELLWCGGHVVADVECSIRLLLWRLLLLVGWVLLLFEAFYLDVSSPAITLAVHLLVVMVVVV